MSNVLSSRQAATESDINLFQKLAFGKENTPSFGTFAPTKSAIILWQKHAQGAPVDMVLIGEFIGVGGKKKGFGV